MRARFVFALLTISALAASALGGCPSHHDDEGPAGGPVTGAVSNHCAGKKQAVTDAACRPTTSDAGVPDALASDGGVADAASDATTDAADAKDAEPDGDHEHDAAGGGGEYGLTRYNTESDDDQCKYHVKFTVDPVRQGQDVFFNLAVTTMADGKPLKSGRPRAEVFLDETHPAPNTAQTAVETSEGSYKLGPVRFDAGGRWTVRFHFRDECVDGDESPHGHVAFFIDVPGAAHGH
jgi:hypothetical protein